MSKRILMRLGKTPFEPMSPWETLKRNSIGGNNGNLVFGYAAHKLLSSQGTTVDANRYVITPSSAARINEQYDGFVLPLANAFRPSFKAEMIATTEFIKRLNIPFMMLSGGAQLPLDGNPESLKPIEAEVKAFAAAVLDKSPKLSVRGPLTAEYLASLGIHDVEVVGCPSMTLLKPGHTVEKSVSLSDEAPVAFNIETSKALAAPLFQSIANRGSSVYFPQDRKTLEMMLWGSTPYPDGDTRLPLSLNHPVYSRKSVEYMLDAPTWISRLKDFSFSVGPRIHGNIAAMLAGTPAVVLCHDSRTLELAEYHAIPHRVVTENESALTLDELYEEADYSRFNNLHQQNKQKMLRFVEQSGFSHIYSDDDVAALERYEELITTSSLPESLSTTTFSQDATDNAGRVSAINTRLNDLEALAKRHRNQLEALRTENRSQKDNIKSLKERNNALSNELARLGDPDNPQEGTLAARVRIVENRVSIKANIRKLFGKK